MGQRTPTTGWFPFTKKFRSRQPTQKTEFGGHSQVMLRLQGTEEDVTIMIRCFHYFDSVISFNKGKSSTPAASILIDFVSLSLSRPLRSQYGVSS